MTLYNKSLDYFCIDMIPNFMVIIINCNKTRPIDLTTKKPFPYHANDDQSLFVLLCFKNQTAVAIQRGERR